MTACLSPISAMAASPKRGDYDLNPAWRDSVGGEWGTAMLTILDPPEKGRATEPTP
jgi:hypothetical protein